MASTIKLKNSTTAGNSPSSLSQGEVAINVADGGLFYGTTGGTSVSSSLLISHLTASGDISASGNITASNIDLPGDNKSITFDNATKLIGDHSIDGFQIRTQDATPIVFKTNGNNIRATIAADGEATFAGVLNSTKVNTGQGDTEVHLMDQNIRTSDNVEFVNITATGNTVLGNASTDTHTITGHITTSGNISSSGTGENFFGGDVNIIGANLVLDNNQKLVFNNSVGNEFSNIFMNTNNTMLFQNLVTGGDVVIRAGNAASANNRGNVIIQDVVTDKSIATFGKTDGLHLSGSLTASGDISASGNLIGTQLDVNGFAGAVKVTGGDTGNLFAINNIDTLNLGKLTHLTTTNLVGSLHMSQPDAGHITASGNIRGTMPQIISANMGNVNLSTENFIPLAEGEIEGTNGDHPRVNLIAPFSGSLRRVVMRSNAAFGTSEFTASLHTVRPGGTLGSDKDTVGQCFVDTAAANNAYAVVFDFANSVVGSNVIDGGDRVLIGVESTRTNSQNYFFTSVFTWDYQETTGLQTTSTSTSGGSI